MSSFGKQQEANDGFVKELYTGVANFKVTDVNPNHEALKGIFGDNVKEPVYTGEGKSGEGENEVKFPQIRIDLFIETEPKEEGEQAIKTKLTYYVGHRSRTTTDGTKVQCINAYGRTAWLTKEQLQAKQALYEFTGEKGTYRFSGEKVRPALNGEPEFIEMLRNLLNLPSPDSVDDKKNAESYFSVDDWKKIISGDTGFIKGLVKSTQNKIGLLLGVKTVGDKMYQDVYNKKTLRQYSLAGGKFDYLRRDVENTQSNGGYPSTNFGDKSYKLNVYNEDAKPSNGESLFGGEDAPSFGEFNAGDF